jgi:ribosome-binding protein aMBF1 (putative translation factor)
MSEAKARLARAVVDAREAKGWLVRQLAQAAGLSTATIRAFENAEMGFRGCDCTQHGLEEALGWTPGNAAALLGEHEAQTRQCLGQHPRPSD